MTEYVKDQGGGMGVPITLAELCQQENISLTPDVDHGLLATYGVYPLIDTGAPAGGYTPPSVIIETVPTIWEVVYPPLSASAVKQRDVRIVLDQYRAKIAKGKVHAVLSGSYWFSGSMDLYNLTRVAIEADQVNTFRLYSVSGASVTASDAAVNKSDQQMLFTELARYIQQCSDALRAAVSDVIAGNPPDYDSHWATATGSPATSDDLTSGAALEEVLVLSGV
jgi:hypothetical protein